MKISPIQKEVYQNYLFLHPDGTEMFRCSFQLASWYLKKNLAVQVSEDTYQLLFEPKGKGRGKDNPFYLEKLKNICVVCGSEDHLSRHHIVPYCYRRYFPLELKNKDNYDVLMVCIDCHEKYELSGWELKKQLEVKYDASVNGVGLQKPLKELINISSAAYALMNYGAKIPEPRKSELNKIVEDYLGRELAPEDLAGLQKLARTNSDQFISHGQLVVEQLDNITEFEELWRQHFVDVMKPKFLPEHWRVIKGG